MKKTKKPLVISLIAFAVSTILVIVAIAVALNVSSQINATHTEYAAAVKLIDEAKKDFSLGEVAEMGPYDVRVASLEGHYTPTDDENTAIQEFFSRQKRFDSINGYKDIYGYSLGQDEAQYIKVVLNARYNSDRSQYDTLSRAGDSWLENIGSMSTGATKPANVAPDVSDYKALKQLESGAADSNGSDISLIYRLPAATNSLTLGYKIDFFTKRSFLVGTEGMPRKEFSYSMAVQ